MVSTLMSFLRGLGLSALASLFGLVLFIALGLLLDASTAVSILRSVAVFPGVLVLVWISRKIGIAASFGMWTGFIVIWWLLFFYELAPGR